MAGNDDNLFSHAQREEIKDLARQTVIESGFESNGPETRMRNIKRVQFIDWAMDKFDHLSVNVGRAVTITVVVAILGLVWVGIKTKILS
jgi:hypothetical protein